jgi:hypothetical protein
MANIEATAQRRLRTAERKKKVLALRLSGSSFQAIGDALGLTRAGVHKLYKGALAEIPEPEARAERKASLARVEQDLQTLNVTLGELRRQAVTPESADTVARLVVAKLKCEARISLLLGLDSARRVELETSSRLNAHELTQLTDLLDQRDSQQREASQAPAIETTATTAPNGEPPEARQIDFTPLDAAVDQLDAAESK